ncbi:DUF3048 domain-containing protein [Kribbella speibonae]|uniref:DUF3048 domain-containing protein n=2 Tax=Kribbella speibonae TaxID=1572660 RepID=A0ABY2A6S3_9ACTN|nr:DUF3048 domain-containing protein [Kribbella speibonae]
MGPGRLTQVCWTASTGLWSLAGRTTDREGQRMNRIRRVLQWLSGRRARLVPAAVVVVALVAAGVGFSLWRGDGEPAPPAGTPTAPAGEGPVDMAGRAPLTGVPAKDALNRPAVTVKISNTADAHPQRGLGDADIVFVEPITGGTTRLAAIFHSKLPAQVGPVRSLRPMDAALIGPTKGIIADTMADRWVLEYVDRVADLDNLGSLRVPSGTYRLDDTRRAPNHVFARPGELLRLSDRKAPPSPYFSYAAGLNQSTAQRSGTRAASVTIAYGGSATATWTYDAASHRWVRAEKWSPHLIEGSGQVAADNIVVLTAQRDTSFPKAKPTMTVLDVFDASGTLKLFTGGKVVSGRWSKGTVNEPFEFTTADGKPLLLTPGTTWIECALTTMPVQVR